jgi:lipopolysaccharide heptosyltransferase II
MLSELSIQPTAWADVTRILCVRLDTLGDVLMTGPALRALKESRTGRTLTLMTSPSGAEGARLLPEIDRVLVYEAPWMKGTAVRGTSGVDLEMVECLRERKYEAAVIFTGYSQSALPAALLCYLADIPYRLAHCRENPYQLLTHWVREREPDVYVRHEVRRQLDLVSTIDAHTADDRLSLRVPPDTSRKVSELLSDLVGDRPWMIIHAGATASSRRYPPEGFASVADRLREELGYDVIFTGTASERDLIESIQAQMRGSSHSLAGLLDLPAFAALIAQSPILLSNNTGAVHVAAAVGTPVVDLYALTNPQHTPWRVPQRVLFHDVPCRNCYKSICPEGHHECLRLVTSESVVRAVQALLAETLTTVGDCSLVHPRH